MEESGLDTVFYVFTIVPQEVAGKLLKIIKPAKLFNTIKVRLILRILQIRVQSVLRIEGSDPVIQLNSILVKIQFS
jgi:hypothetical protein